MSSTSTTQPRPPITDNPWFWLYAFGTAGLVGAMLLGSKFEARQQGLDANFTRRQTLLSQRAGEQMPVESSSPKQNAEPRYIHFYWLYGVVGVGTIAAWVMLWRHHFHGSQTDPVRRDNKKTPIEMEARE